MVERDRIAPVDTGDFRRGNSGKSGMPVEPRIILLREIEEAGGDRQRNHDRVDAFGADGNCTDDRRRYRRQHDREWYEPPPTPAATIDIDVIRAEARPPIRGAAAARALLHPAH